jgi:hypothetical protein
VPLYSGNLSGIVSSNAVSNLMNLRDVIKMSNLLREKQLYMQYRARNKPWYTLGHGIVLIYICIGFITSVIHYTLLRMENARRDRGERDEVITGLDGGAHQRKGDPKNGVYLTVEDAKRDKGDGWSGYRYML